MIPILILAAGGSTRMRGGDKLLEHLDGVPLLSAQVAKARAVSQRVFVALPDADHPRAKVISDAVPLFVPQAVEGMSGTLRGAVAALPDAPAFMMLLADLPEITADDLQTLLNAYQDRTDNLIWRGTTDDGHAGNPIIFARALWPEFAKISGDGGGLPVVRAAGDAVHLVPLNGNRARRDLDTPEDWAAWRAETKR